MVNVIDKMLRHPISTIIIISSLSNAAARIIRVVKGGKAEPIIKVEIPKTETEKISNLITDMALANASDEELMAAIRHSIVVIDADKCKSDCEQSEIDNNIKTLKQKYQSINHR